MQLFLGHHVNQRYNYLCFCTENLLDLDRYFFMPHRFRHGLRPYVFIPFSWLWYVKKALRDFFSNREQLSSWTKEATVSILVRLVKVICFWLILSHNGMNFMMPKSVMCWICVVVFFWCPDVKKNSIEIDIFILWEFRWLPPSLELHSVSLEYGYISTASCSMQLHTVKYFSSFFEM